MRKSLLKILWIDERAIQSFWLRLRMDFFGLLPTDSLTVFKFCFVLALIFWPLLVVIFLLSLCTVPLASKFLAHR